MEGVYSITDLALVATLKYHHFNMIDWKENEGKIIFIFDDTKPLQDLIKQYELGQLQVEPRTYWEEVKFLKGILIRNRNRLI